MRHRPETKAAQTKVSVESSAPPTVPTTVSETGGVFEVLSHFHDYGDSRHVAVPF